MVFSSTMLTNRKKHYSHHTQPNKTNTRMCFHYMVTYNLHNKAIQKTTLRIATNRTLTLTSAWWNKYTTTAYSTYTHETSRITNQIIIKSHTQTTNIHQPKHETHTHYHINCIPDDQKYKQTNTSNSYLQSTHQKHLQSTHQKHHWLKHSVTP